MFKDGLGRNYAWTSRHKVVLTCISLLLLGAVAMVPIVQRASSAYGATTKPEAAQMAASFVNSVCVGVHWSYPDTPYGANYEGVKKMLVASGIRHVRGSERAQDLGKLGIKSIYSADVDNNSNGDEGTVQKIVSNLKAAIHDGAVYDAVESPNEPDLFWRSFHKTYKGQGFPNGVLAFQKDLYTALKSDPVTAKLIVIGPSFGVTYDPSKNPFAHGAFAKYVDWGNFHPYPGGGNSYSFPQSYDTIDKYYWHSDQPSVNMDEWPFALDTYAHQFEPKPMAATETGYNTSKGSTSERVQGKYMPRLFLEYFRKGIQRTCSYEFVDEWKNPSNPEANFGLLHNDLSPKPAYNAVKNLISVLNDPGANFKPGALDYTLKVDPAHGYDRTQYVHHLLLQKQDSSFYLVLWHEISDEDVSVTPHREILPPAMPTTLTLHTSMKGAQVYALQDNGQLNASSISINNNQIRLNVTDKAMVVKLTPTAHR